jgi:hypothetical protein
VLAKVGRTIVEWYPYAEDNDILVLIDSWDEDIHIATDLERIGQAIATLLVVRHPQVIPSLLTFPNCNLAERFE